MLLRQIYQINRSEDKVEGLEVFMDDFELLRLEIRLATDLKIMSVRRQADLAVLMDSIGRQVTGWRNASRNARVAPVTADASAQ